MNPNEIRMRCIEAIASGGVRDTRRLINDAVVLEEWVTAAPDKEQTPRAAAMNAKADKAKAPA